MIQVKEIPLDSKHGKKKFFKFIIDLYKGNKYCAPNFYFDEFAEFDPAVNDAFRFADCRMFLAYKDRKVAGRIAGIYHRGVNEKNNVNQLRFTRFDVIDDFEVTKALFAELQKWAKELGATEIIGPMSFSDLNEEGMLIHGFDTQSTYISIYNHPYYIEHMEKLGAYKMVDWNAYRMEVPKEPDERLQRLSDMAAEKYGYSVLDVGYYLKHDKKKLDAYIMDALHVMDEAFEDLFGTSPTNDKQKKREMETVYQVLIPDFAAVILKDDKVVAYGFMMPSMSEAMRKGRGHIIPFGLKAYIKAMKHPEVVDLLQIALSPKHANTGAVAMIMNHCLKGLQKHNVKIMEAGPELEYNFHVQNLWKNFNPKLIRKFRCWGLKVEGVAEEEAATATE